MYILVISIILKFNGLSDILIRLFPNDIRIVDKKLGKNFISILDKSKIYYYL